MKSSRNWGVRRAEQGLGRVLALKRLLVRYTAAVAVVPLPSLLAEEVTGRDAAARQIHSKTAGKA